jgi:arabinogalactan oligomer / maltooligosaccharide transport system substrate-binding protein
MRRTFAGIAGTAALALTLAACGGGTSEDAADTSNDQAAADPTAVEGELTWWDTSDPTNEAPAFKELIKQFNEEYPNVKINYESVPFAEAQNKFKTAAASGSGAPDILRAEVAWVPEFASLGYLYALDGTPLLEEQDDFLPTPMSSNVFDGKTYGVPQVTDTLALMYNKKLFEEAGIDAAPTTWDEVSDAAAKLKKVGADGIYINSGGYFTLPFIYGEGGDLVDTEAQEIVVNSPEAVAGIQEAQDLVKSGAAVKPVANDPYGTMMTLFKEGKVGMIINGPWEVANIDGDPNFGGFDNLGVAPVPAGSAQSGAPVGGHNYVIYEGMDEAKAEAAIAFVNFMSSAESQAFVAEELGLLPTRQSAYDLPEVQDNAKVAAFQPALESALPRPWIPEGGQFFAPLDEMATKVLIQGADVQKSLDEVADKYKSEVVKDYNLG